MRKTIWLLLGFNFTALGILGIFLPLLPTTPFLLLAAACFSRGSKRYHRWLLNHRLLGRYVRYYHDGRPSPRGVKIATLVLLWLTILSSIVFATNRLWLRILLAAIAVAVTLHVLSLGRKREED